MFTQWSGVCVGTQTFLTHLPLSNARDLRYRDTDNFLVYGGAKNYLGHNKVYLRNYYIYADLSTAYEGPFTHIGDSDVFVNIDLTVAVDQLKSALPTAAIRAVCRVRRSVNSTLLRHL